MDQPDRLYCADHHFFHEGILTHCAESRPFDNVSQMNEYMIEAHNARASNSTDVYILGDFACGHKLDGAQIRKVFEKLKGRKHLIIGNHDEKNQDILGLRWSSRPSFMKMVKDKDRSILLCHYALRSWPGLFYDAYHFYGHTHGRLPSQGRSMDVGVDSWNLSPRTASEIIERMRNWNPDFETYAPERKTLITCAEENQPGEEYVPERRTDPEYNALRR
ncbi:metallophosphoesterase [Rhizobium sp. BK176]|uniref:metallophosphoesterase n=1 Tax=Rhizobium sp. BK176 TaxID=2587071 RepID=UPI0021688D40|nr:metallophosphoesterase [Rhizobium sp. BK176]MCS4088976.1 calcineurin-like phosphoesterase family protein [Rhizobium sp. BK176]